MRMPGGKWKPLESSHVDLSWREVLWPVFEYFAERTPGSFIEEKELALTWHYRNADVDFGRQQANELFRQLDSYSARLPINIEASRPNKMIEVRPQEVNNSTLAKRLLLEFGLTPDVVLCIGDAGVPDESVLAQRNLAAPHLFRAVVNPNKSGTERVYGLRDSADVAAFLTSLLSQQAARA